jgi:CheY-like chemotaxis protein
MEKQSALPQWVLALLDNLFFVAKLDAAATQTGLRMATARTLEKALTQAQSDLPVLIVIDLDAQGCRPFEFIRAIKADERLRTIPLLGFVSHVNTGVQQQARAAGCDRVLARSVFSRDLPELLQKAINQASPANGA